MKTNPTPTPPLVDVIKETLAGHHYFRYEVGASIVSGCSCQIDEAGTVVASLTSDFLTHQARAVLDALAKTGGVEWGIRYGDGDIDESYLHKSEAEADIANLRKRIRLGASPTEGKEPMTLLTRRRFEHAGPWTAVEG